MPNRTFCYCKSAKERREKDFVNFVLSRSCKSLNDIMGNTWKMHIAENELLREKKIKNGCYHRIR